MQEERQWWTFTFGCGQVNAGKCVKIYGTYSEARSLMFMKYGDKWAFQYSQAEWEDNVNSPDRWWPVEETLEEMSYEPK